MVKIKDCRKTIDTEEGNVTYYSLRELESQGLIKDLKKMPYSIKVLVESLLRQKDGKLITDDDVATIASWNSKKNVDDEKLMRAVEEAQLKEFINSLSV